MCCKDGARDFSGLDRVIDEYMGIDGSLIAILQKAQDIFGYLPRDVIEHIADRTGIKAAKILGVVTFYTQFRLKPAGKYVIMLCQGTACHVNGSSAIEEVILSFLSESQPVDQLPLKEGDTTADGLFTVQNVACLGCCSLAPVMMINGETHGNLTPDKARGVLQEIIASEKNRKSGGL